MSKRWQRCKLGDLATSFVSGGTPDTKVNEYWDGDVPWTTSAPLDMDDIVLGEPQRYITKEGLVNSASNLVPANSLLVATRVGVGKAVKNLIDIAISQDLTGVQLATDRVLPQYIAYCFKRSDVQRFLYGRKRGTTIKGVSRFDLEQVPITVPPLATQETVCNLLDALLQSKQLLAAEVSGLQELREAVTLHLFTHGLKKDQLKLSPAVGLVPESWQIVDLDSVADIVYGAQAAVAHLLDENLGTPILTNVNISQNGFLDLSLLRYYQIPEQKKERLTLKKGDVLFNWRSGSQDHVGKTAIFDLDGDFTFSSFILRFRPGNKIQSRYLFYYLQTLKARGFFVRNRQQSSVNSVFNASVAAKIPIALPPLSEQEEITNVLAQCDKTLTLLHQELTLSNELFAALIESLDEGSFDEK